MKTYRQIVVIAVFCLFAIIITLIGFNYFTKNEIEYKKKITNPDELIYAFEIYRHGARGPYKYESEEFILGNT